MRREGGPGSGDPEAGGGDAMEASQVEVAGALEAFSPLEFAESQALWFRGRGYRNWEQVSPLDRAEFFAIAGLHKEAGEAAAAAGLERPSQIQLMLQAVKARGDSLKYIVLGEHPEVREEWEALNAVQGALLAERAQLEAGAR